MDDAFGALIGVVVTIGGVVWVAWMAGAPESSQVILGIIAGVVALVFFGRDVVR